MLLVILGAGASADTFYPERDGQWRPPLTTELFAPRFYGLLARRAGAVVIADWVRTAAVGGSTVEEALKQLQSDTTDPLRARHILDTQFYLQNLLWDCSAHWGTQDAGMTNYLRLISDLEEWRSRMREQVVYVTFNYDWMLEEAMRIRFGFKFQKVDDYLRHDHTIIKIHGSANWMQQTDIETVEGVGLGIEDLLDAAHRLKRLDNFVMGGPGSYQYDLRGVVPAIAIPAEPKAEFVAPQTHLDFLIQALPSTRGILSIGWRGADRHFVELMKTGRVPPSAPVTVVTRRLSTGEGDDRPEVLEASTAGVMWPSDLGLHSAVVVRSGFSGLLHLAGPLSLRRVLSNLG